MSEDPQMKIMVVITRFDILGGAQVHVANLCQGLVERGHKVCLVVGESDSELLRLIDNRVTVEVIGLLRRKVSVLNDLRALRALKAKIKKFKPDVISVHSVKASALTRLANAGRVPLVYTVHGWVFTEGKPKLHRVVGWLSEKLLSNLTTSIIVVSEYDRQLALRHHIRCKGGIRVVRNGVSADSLRSDRQETVTSSDMTVRMVCVARFEEPKDHLTLIAALSEMEKDVRWVLRLVGEGPLMAECKRLADELGLSKHVEFLGQRQDVEAILENSDLFVLISKWEGLPISIIEALRAGLPVIASDVGGVSELVTEGINGYLISEDRAGQRAQIAARIYQLLNDPDLRLNMGWASRKAFEQSYTSEIMIKETEKVFLEASETA